MVAGLELSGYAFHFASNAEDELAERALEGVDALEQHLRGCDRFATLVVGVALGVVADALGLAFGALDERLDVSGDDGASAPRRIAKLV